MDPNQSLLVEDAQMIKKACLGWGTDENVIISILANRTMSQRKLIRTAYQDIYGEDLITQLKSELSGDFQRAICYWLLDHAERDAVMANTALNKSIPDYRVIVEIACIRSPEELLEAKRAYHDLYKHSIEEDVASNIKTDIQKLVVGLVSSFRYDGDEVNERLAYSEANMIHDEIELNSPNHEEIIRILSTRSKAQLVATFNHYRDNHGKSITKSLSGDPTDEILAASRIAIRCIKNPKKYYAKVLRNAVNKVGTDEDGLSRVIVTRAEKDLKEIKEMFFKRNNVSLNQVVADETSGDYKAFLLALLENKEKSFELN